MSSLRLRCTQEKESAPHGPQKRRKKNLKEKINKGASPFFFFPHLGLFCFCLFFFYFYGTDSSSSSSSSWPSSIFLGFFFYGRAGLTTPRRGRWGTHRSSFFSSILLVLTSFSLSLSLFRSFVLSFFLSSTSYPVLAELALHRRIRTRCRWFHFLLSLLLLLLLYRVFFYRVFQDLSFFLSSTSDAIFVGFLPMFSIATGHRRKLAWFTEFYRVFFTEFFMIVPFFFPETGPFCFLDLWRHLCWVLADVFDCHGPSMENGLPSFTEFFIFLFFAPSCRLCLWRRPSWICCRFPPSEFSADGSPFRLLESAPVSVLPSFFFFTELLWIVLRRGLTAPRRGAPRAAYFLFYSLFFFVFPSFRLGNLLHSSTASIGRHFSSFRVLFFFFFFLFFFFRCWRVHGHPAPKGLLFFFRLENWKYISEATWKEEEEEEEEEEDLVLFFLCAPCVSCCGRCTFTGNTVGEERPTQRAAAAAAIPNEMLPLKFHFTRCRWLSSFVFFVFHPILLFQAPRPVGLDEEIRFAPSVEYERQIVEGFMIFFSFFFFFWGLSAAASLTPHAGVETRREDGGSDE